MAVEIKRVETKKDLKRFINFHYDLYQGNAYDAPPLFLDDWNTLRKFQYSRVEKTDNHDNRRSGTLDDCRNAGSKGNALRLVACQFFQNLLHLGAGSALERVTH